MLLTGSATRAESAPLASNSTGNVVYSDWGCDYFIVQSVSGYGLLEWFGGTQPDRGNVVYGEFESYGMTTLFNQSTRATVDVWVEDFWLSRQSVIDKYYQQCGVRLR